MNRKTLTHYLISLVIIILLEIVTLKVDSLSVQAQQVVTSSTVLPPQPYLEYQIYGGGVVTDETMPTVLSNGQGDYHEIYEKHHLCDLIKAGQVDEVWIWAGNGDGVTKGNLWEWTASGQEWGGDTPDCGKVVTTMTFNYLREVDVPLESLNHRLEGFFGYYFPCDFSTETWPWAGSTTWPFSDCGNKLSNRYGFVARPFAGNDEIAGCGDAHHPPNILTYEDYIYNDITAVQTICPTWSQDGSSVPTTVNCYDWGCTHWGFHLWWMQNIPGLDNINKDRNGNPQPNWWSYLFGKPFSPLPYHRYLPIIMSPQPNTIASIPTPMRQTQFLAIPKSDFATQGGSTLDDYATVASKKMLYSPSFLVDQPAQITRTVYVLYYPGYGGTPRTDINMMTQELIGLFKEATIYHGYQYASPMPKGIFIGQDGYNYAGKECNTGTDPDNVHIRLEGLKTNVQAISYKLEDVDGNGVWATPCDPISNWLLYVNEHSDGQADLYFKPFRTAPDGTSYLVSIQYSDGSVQYITLVGTLIKP